jgi:hypothetical protein
MRSLVHGCGAPRFQRLGELLIHFQRALPEGIRQQRIGGVGGGGAAVVHRVPVPELYGFLRLLRIGAGLAGGRLGFIAEAQDII